MSWLPLGPDFVFSPRLSPFKRLSSRNEQGSAGAITGIAIDPNNARRMYLVQRGWWNGASVWRTADGGRTWKCLSDATTLRDTTRFVDPGCVAVHPTLPNVVYLGAPDAGRVYVSTDYGDRFQQLGGDVAQVWKLIPDDGGNGIVYASTPTALFMFQPTVSDPTVGRWTSVLSTPTATDYFTTSFAHSVTLRRDAAFLRGALPVRTLAHDRSDGCDRSVAAGERWRAASGVQTGDPLDPDGTFTKVFVFVVPRRPSRVYAWLARMHRPELSEPAVYQPLALYTTDDFAAARAWERIELPRGIPDGDRSVLEPKGIAPNSPGDGRADVFFAGYVILHRSPDSGRAWQPDASASTLIGGLSRSTRRRVRMGRRRPRSAGRCRR